MLALGPSNLSRLPKVSLNPAKIRDRWQLAAFGLLVWLFVAYSLVSTEVSNIRTAIILTPTFLLLFLMLMLSFGSDRDGLTKAPPNLASRHKSGPMNIPAPEELERLNILLKMYQDPRVQRMLKDALKDER